MKLIIQVYITESQQDTIKYAGFFCFCFERLLLKPLVWCFQTPVQSTSEKFENTALFLRLGLPSTLIRHENGAFRKRSLTEEFENSGLAF